MKKKKIIISAISIILILAFGLVYIFFIAPEIPPKVLSLSEEGLPTEGVNLVAHRGFSAVAPENSAAAFREAGKSEFFAAECDIHLSKDNVWVLMVTGYDPYELSLTGRTLAHILSDILKKKYG